MSTVHAWYTVIVLKSQLNSHHFFVLCVGAACTCVVLWALYLPAVVTQYTAHAEVVPVEPVTPVQMPIPVAATTTASTSQQNGHADSISHELDSSAIRSVPFYSQFADISAPSWQKLSCGIASLAMLIDYYTTAVAPDILLDAGIQSGAYLTDVGWSHAGLIALADAYGLNGYSKGLSHLTMREATKALESELQTGPVMASVHYTFDPQNPIPHLVVITGIADGRVYYNDPAETSGGGDISLEQFQSSWKKRYIAIRPAEQNILANEVD